MQHAFSNTQAQGRDIVYIDEIGFVVEAFRDYGYSSRGQRCVDIKNWQAKGRVNAIGA